MSTVTEKPKQLYINKSNAMMNLRVKGRQLQIPHGQVVPTPEQEKSGITPEDFRPFVSQGFLSRYSGPNPHTLPKGKEIRVTDDELDMLKKHRQAKLADQMAAATGIKSTPSIGSDAPQATELQQDVPKTVHGKIAEAPKQEETPEAPVLGADEGTLVDDMLKEGSDQD